MFIKRTKLLIIQGLQSIHNVSNYKDREMNEIKSILNRAHSLMEDLSNIHV